MGEGSGGVGLCVERLDRRKILLGEFFIQEHGVLLLDVSRVQQHEFAKVGGGVCAVNFATKPIPAEDGNDTAVVNMGVAEHHRVDGGRVEWKFGAVLDGFVATALIHAAFEEKSLVVDFEKVFGTGGSFAGA
jgi:hypothetical protein